MTADYPSYTAPPDDTWDDAAEARASVPAKPLADDIIDRIAKEVAAQVSDHIEMMYPKAAQAVAWKSASRSIQGVVRNNMAWAARAAENGTIEQCIKKMRANRLSLRRARKEGLKGGYHDL